MPVREYKITRPSGYAELVDALFKEWTQPDPSAAEPIILEERDRKQNIVHVYVVWSKWSHVDRGDRSEIIMDAATKKFTQDDLLNITIAFGLTPDEAERMGIHP